MDKNFHTVLLDNDKTTNFLNTYLLLKSKLYGKIESYTNPQKLLNKFNQDLIFNPNLILLDFEMPSMNGREFLNHFNKIKSQRELNTKVFMLTSSIKVSEYRSISNSSIAEFLIKPLNSKLIESLYDKHFSHHYRPLESNYLKYKQK